MKVIKFLFIAFLLVVMSCNSDDEPVTSQDNFDRKTMLINWADNIIIPAYSDYDASLTTMQNSVASFLQSPTTTGLQAVRNSWLTAYKKWQHVEMFAIGKAEELTIANYTNIYPTDINEIVQNVLNGNTNLELSSKYDEQGFPAIDYLINGLADTDELIVAQYADATTGSRYKAYLTMLVDRLVSLTNAVVSDWNEGYRDTFINNNGSSATSSTNKIVNDFILYYESSLRAGKIGIPAGIFSGTAIPTAVEAYYYPEVSRELFLEGLNAAMSFFNGEYYDGVGKGESLNSYLDYLTSINKGADIASLINSQFIVIKNTAEGLNDSFVFQIEDDNSKMLNTYDELQKLVVLFKVDMTQAMNIKIDYVDADGD
jgi:predicted lipoprotein